jgi:hypothetical protein
MGRIVDFFVGRLDPEGVAITVALRRHLADAPWDEMAWLAEPDRRVVVHATTASGREYLVELLGYWVGAPRESTARLAARVKPRGESNRQWIDHFADMRREPSEIGEGPARTLRPHLEAWLSELNLTITADVSDDPEGWGAD